MPDKPIKNGFKFWVLGSSIHGYPIIYEFHQCKRDVCFFYILFLLIYF
jgi:hypothetical protein